jgi:hypothetical protein
VTSYETIFEFLGVNFKTPESVMASLITVPFSILFAATQQLPTPLLTGLLPLILSSGRGPEAKFNVFILNILSILS